MPKLGMQPIRRDALVSATIAEIGEQGTLDVTVARIARRAGMSSALAHHYFGSKSEMLMAAMRHTMEAFAAEVRVALTRAKSPRARAEALVRASFSPQNFRQDTVAVWLNFYVLAQNSAEAARLLAIYHRRLKSNLTHALRPDLGARAADAASRIAALIDGAYLHQTLGQGAPDPRAAIALILDYIALEVDRAKPGEDNA